MQRETCVSHNQGCLLAVAYCIQLRSTGLYGMGQRRGKGASPFRCVTRGTSCSFTPVYIVLHGRGVHSYWALSWKRRSRWMRRCICVSCFPPLPPFPLGVCSNSTFPSYSAHLTPIVFAMRKLEPQMVNSDKVQNLSPLSPLGVINLSL